MQASKFNFQDSESAKNFFSAHEICVAMEMMVLIRRKRPLNVRTSTTNCVRAIGILISRTAREEAREEGGERTLEHW